MLGLVPGAGNLESCSHMGVNVWSRHNRTTVEERCVSIPWRSEKKWSLNHISDIEKWVVVCKKQKLPEAEDSRCTNRWRGKDMNEAERYSGNL